MKISKALVLDRIDFKDVAAFLPLKVLLNNSVYTLHIEYNEETSIMNVAYQSRLYKLDIEKSISYSFDNEYLEIHLLAILSDLLDTMAVEVNEKLQPVGNENIVYSIDELRRIYNIKLDDMKSMDNLKGEKTC